MYMITLGQYNATGQKQEDCNQDISSYLSVVIVRVVVALVSKMIWSIVMLGVVVIVSGSAVLHVSPHALHPVLGRAGQQRLSEHRH